jgi:hypothetical protein
LPFFRTHQTTTRVDNRKSKPIAITNTGETIIQALRQFLSADGAEYADIGDALSAVAARLRAACAALSHYNPSDECDQAAQKEQGD